MTSHNTSEWDAALLGILKALELALHANHVRGSRNLGLEVVGDSILVVTAFKQRVSAHFPSQLRLMLSLATKWKRVMGGDVTFRHVKRNFNKEADALATAFLIMHPKKSELLAKNLEVGFEVLNNQRKRIIITKA